MLFFFLSFVENSRNNNCCGKLSYNSNLLLCCDGKLHEKMSNRKCCGTKIYNSKTQWCKKKQDILPLGEDSCYGEEYKTKTHICCHHQKHVYEKTTKTDDQCCGSTPYSTKDYFCKNETELISSNYFMIFYLNFFLSVFILIYTVYNHPFMKCHFSYKYFHDTCFAMNLISYTSLVFATILYFYVGVGDPRFQIDTKNTSTLLYIKFDDHCSYIMSHAVP